MGKKEMSYIFDPAPQPSVAIQGSEDLYPVRRIYCVGRNYAAHAREMGRDPDREPPFFFMKPADAVVADGSDIPYAKATGCGEGAYFRLCRRYRPDPARPAACGP